MKKLVIVLFVLFSSLSLFAQDHTLIGDIKSVGFYISPVFKYGRLNDNSINAFRNDSTEVNYVGGEIGWVINHNLVLGLAGYALTSDISGLGVKVDDASEYKFYYGGLLLKYILSPHSLLHFNVHSLIGAGIFQYEDTEEYGFYSPRDRHHFSYYRGYDYGMSKDTFYVFEPGVDLMLNVHKNVRIGVGATYRYVKGFDYHLSGDYNLNGYTAQAMVNIGKF